MALFELSGTRLEAAVLGEPAEAPQRQTVLGAVRSQLVDVLRRPVFPVAWEREGETDVLTALDASSQVMCIELLDSLDADALVAAMARAAAIFIFSVIFLALTSSAPRKIYGKPRTLLI